jgi:DNA polymerase (family 10)
MTMELSNAAIADALQELGDLYELDGAVIHRVLAYRAAARTVRECTRSVASLTRAGKVTELPGIGATLEAKIITLLDTGAIPASVKLRAKFPVGLIEITRLPGLGPKRARLLHDELGIDSIDALRQAALAGRVSSVRGLGPKFEASVLAALDRAGAGQDEQRMLLPLAIQTADALVAELTQHGPAGARFEAAGSARRQADTVKDIDLVAITTAPQTLAEAVAGCEQIASVSSSGPTGARALTHSGLRIDLRIGTPAQRGNLLQHFTGSAAHNAALRERAVRTGLHVSEYAIAEDAGGAIVHCATEDAVYEHLGMAFIAPELREDRGELEAAVLADPRQQLPDLVTGADIRGDLHCHSTASDGRATIEEMALAARALGYEYLAITDHSASHGFGNGVSPAQLERQIERIHELDGSIEGIRLLAGSEVNVLPDGSLDYADELLAALDWVIASVHTAFASSEAAMTARVIAAIEHPHVDAIGHPTGRLLLQRAPYAVDLEAVFAAAARTHTMLEINANPRRRDLSDTAARAASGAGVMLVINSDAHGTDTLSAMRWGVATARRAWLGAADVANTRSWDELRAITKRGRSQAAAARAPEQRSRRHSHG